MFTVQIALYAGVATTIAAAHFVADTGIITAAPFFLGSAPISVRCGAASCTNHAVSL